VDDFEEEDAIEEDPQHDILDEEEEEEAETRCICGQMEPPDADGLFIQCEKCSVWQHGYCVSIKDNVPEKYWCEECKPELHSIIIRPHGKISRYLPVQYKDISNKRKSKRAHDEEKEDAKQKRSRERATLNSREDARYEAMIQRVLEESKKDALPEANTEDEKSSRRSRRKVRDDTDLMDEGDTTRLSDPEGDPESNTDKPSNDSRVKKLKKESGDNESESNDTTNSTQKKKQKRTKRSTQPSSRSSQKDKDVEIDFNKPTKPRLPQQRTTVYEMRKRVAAILEFIGRTQIDIANEQKDHSELTKYVEDDTMKLTVEKMFENYNGSLEIMDGLTRKLLVWEQKFGKFGDK
jgi:hypothetical protein